MTSLYWSLEEALSTNTTCIDQDQENIGKIAKVEGYGLTETGERGSLLETNVTVITNEVCKEYLDYNATDNTMVRQEIEIQSEFRYQ